MESHQLQLILLVAVLGLSSTAHIDSSKDATILKSTFKNDGSGSYSFEYETSDGQTRQESGDLHSPDSPNPELVVRGSFSFTAADGKVYSVQYTADKDGFHPEGDHIKVPPYTPWPTNLHLNEEGSYQPEHNLHLNEENDNKNFNNIYLPSSEKPPVLNNIKPLLFSEDFLNEQIKLSTPKPSSVYIPNGDSFGGYSTTVKSFAPRVKSVTISPINHIADGSSPAPFKKRSDESKSSERLFEVIQNNHAQQGVFSRDN